MRSPVCLLRTLWRSLRYSVYPPVMGHDYVITEEHDNCHVEVARCETCGAVSVAWTRREIATLRVSRPAPDEEGRKP